MHQRTFCLFSAPGRPLSILISVTVLYARNIHLHGSAGVGPSAEIKHRCLDYTAKTSEPNSTETVRLALARRNVGTCTRFVRCLSQFQYGVPSELRVRDPPPQIKKPLLISEQSHTLDGYSAVTSLLHRSFMQCRKALPQQTTAEQQLRYPNKLSRTLRPTFCARCTRSIIATVFPPAYRPAMPPSPLKFELRLPPQQFALVRRLVHHKPQHLERLHDEFPYLVAFRLKHQPIIIDHGGVNPARQPHAVHRRRDVR